MVDRAVVRVAAMPAAHDGVHLPGAARPAHRPRVSVATAAARVAGYGLLAALTRTTPFVRSGPGQIGYDHPDQRGLAALRRGYFGSVVRGVSLVGGIVRPVRLLEEASSR